MNRGLSLIEVLTAILVTAIILTVVFSFTRTGYLVYKNEFEDFIIYNTYRELTVTVRDDLKQIKKVISLKGSELNLERKDGLVIEYRTVKDKEAVFLQRNGEKGASGKVRFTEIRFEGRDKNNRITANPEEMIFIKIYFSFYDRKGQINHDFELFETGIL